MHTRPALVLAHVVTCVALLVACGSTPATEPIATEAVVASTTAEPALIAEPAPTVEPAPTAEPAPPVVSPAPVLAESAPLRVQLEYGMEPDQFGWLQLPDGPAPAAGFPVVVLVHGGFWRQQFDVSLMDGLADDLAARGYASWNIEYRRVGGAGGWPATGQDVAAAIDYLANAGSDHPLDVDRVVSVGHSAGGHLALWALGQPSQITMQGSVGLGAVVDLAYFREAQGLLGGTASEVPDVYVDAAPVLDPDRTVLIQGGADSIVPQASLQPAADRQVPIVVIDGDNHFDLIDPNSASWAAAVTAIEDFVAG